MAEPFFPKPAERTAPPTLAGEPSEAARPTQRVVHRPEPPRDDDGIRELHLSNEEARALLAVTATREGRWRRVAKRGGIALVPVSLVLWLVQSLLGWWAAPILLIAAYWVMRPLFRQRREGWA